MPDHNQNGTDNDHRSDARLFSRRSVLGVTAGLAGIAAVGGTASAATEYDTITVPADTHRDISVGDGETFANKLIDITASGASFRIEARGDNWEVRNVGVKGVYDIHSDGHRQGIATEVGAGATGVIDNFYFADGCPDDVYPGVTGIYVQRSHAGRLKINNVNIQDLPNNAVYASTPGYPENNPHGLPEGGQGVVEITNSYAADCKSSHFRLGTDGSFLRNCVAVGGDRGIWSKFNDTRVVDCDLTGHDSNTADGDVVCGTNSWPSGEQASVTLENTVYGHSAPGDQSISHDGEIIGSSESRSARTSPPSSAPMSAEEAASGGTSDRSTDSSTDSTSEPTTHTFAIEAAANTGWADYTLTTSGEITPGPAADGGDKIVQNDDGTWTVTGFVGNGGIDDFEFTGSVEGWTIDLDADQYTLTLDDNTIAPSDL